MSRDLRQLRVWIVAVPICLMQFMNSARNVPSDGEAELERVQCAWEKNVYFFPTHNRKTALVFTRLGILAFQILWNIQALRTTPLRLHFSTFS